MTCIPTPDHLIGTSASGAEPTTLCRNWQEGCNGVTDGPIDGHLSLCDDCATKAERQKQGWGGGWNHDAL